MNKNCWVCVLQTLTSHIYKVYINMFQTGKASGRPLHENIWPHTWNSYQDSFPNPALLVQSLSAAASSLEHGHNRGLLSLHSTEYKKTK